MEIEQEKNFVIIYFPISTNLYSYNTFIASFHKQTKVLTLSDKWDYSRTTLKHLYIFINRCTPYHNYKKKEILREIKKNTIKIKELN